MSYDIARFKWHQVNSAAAHALTCITSSPGVVYPIASTNLPDQLKQMAGVGSYYATAYTTGMPMPGGFTAGGELLVARTDGYTTKNYQYIFGTGSNGNVYYCGEFKNFPGHHVTSGQAVPLEQLFGNTPIGGK
jgi:hypothetical protein